MEFWRTTAFSAKSRAWVSPFWGTANFLCCRYYVSYLIWFATEKAKTGKTFVAFCGGGEVNSLFICRLRMRRRLKSEIRDQRSEIRVQRVSCQRSGEGLPSDHFDCAPELGNYLQKQWSVVSDQWSVRQGRGSSSPRSPKARDRGHPQFLVMGPGPPANQPMSRSTD